MSTTYYVQENKTKLQAVMRVEPRRMPVGLSSGGWTFMFYGNREAGVKDFASWKAWLLVLLSAGGNLVDEGGSPMHLQSMLDLVECKRTELKVNAVEYPRDEEWLDADGNSFCEGRVE